MIQHLTDALAFRREMQWLCPDVEEATALSTQDPLTLSDHLKVPPTDRTQPEAKDRKPTDASS